MICFIWLLIFICFIWLLNFLEHTFTSWASLILLELGSSMYTLIVRLYGDRSGFVTITRKRTFKRRMKSSISIYFIRIYEIARRVNGFVGLNKNRNALDSALNTLSVLEQLRKLIDYINNESLLATYYFGVWFASNIDVITFVIC